MLILVIATLSLRPALVQDIALKDAEKPDSRLLMAEPCETRASLLIANYSVI